LPKDYDGLVLVEISDLHLGTLLGQRWAERMVQRVNALKPELIVVDGDVIDGNVDRVEPLVPTLKKLRAPLGVWAVTGNHEYYAGLRDSIDLFQRAGFTVLEDRSTKVVPGLTIAGVDDLTARQGDGHTAIAVQKALSNRPAGATIYLSHSPLQAPAAAAAGAGLMICGHTHNGQIWPFNYLVHTRYAYMAGRYQVGNMSLIVCRGTGTWGPRMRLWWPSEIVRIKLRSTS
jgi:predicted MPP superfamily phosphohydrolase